VKVNVRRDGASQQKQGPGATAEKDQTTVELYARAGAAVSVTMSVEEEGEEHGEKGGEGVDGKKRRSE